MPKFYGPVGYGQKVETTQDVWEEVIVERLYRGDIMRDALYIDNKKDVNPDVQVSQLISVVVDPYALEHYFAIRYVLWQGVRWRVANVTIEPPRMILRLGDKYDGPVPKPDDNPTP